MSVLVAQLRKAKGVCQRERCQGTPESKGATRTVCNTCGLELYFSPQTPKVVKLPDIAKEVHNLQSTPRGSGPSTSMVSFDPMFAFRQPPPRHRSTKFSRRRSGLSPQHRIRTVHQRKENANLKSDQARKDGPKRLSIPSHSEANEHLGLFRRIHTTNTAAFPKPDLPRRRYSTACFPDNAVERNTKSEHLDLKRKRHEARKEARNSTTQDDHPNKRIKFTLDIPIPPSRSPTEEYGSKLHTDRTDPESPSEQNIFYGRHSNAWLFNNSSVRGSIKRGYHQLTHKQHMGAGHR